MKFSSILVSLACALAVAPAALAQAEAKYDPPKTAWGVPDLQGFWSSASLTTIQRPQGATGLVVTDEEAAKLFNRNIYTRVAKEESALSKAELLTDANPDRAYNRFWMDPGADLGKIDGKYRSSWVVEPADGQIPYKAAARATRAATSEEEFSDLKSDNPEDRGMPERCIWASPAGRGLCCTIQCTTTITSWFRRPST